MIDIATGRCIAGAGRPLIRIDNEAVRLYTSSSGTSSAYSLDLVSKWISWLLLSKILTISTWSRYMRNVGDAIQRWHLRKLSLYTCNIYLSTCIQRILILSMLRATSNYISIECMLWSAVTPSATWKSLILKYLSLWIGLRPCIVFQYSTAIRIKLYHLHLGRCRCKPSSSFIWYNTHADDGDIVLSLTGPWIFIRMKPGYRTKCRAGRANKRRTSLRSVNLLSGGSRA